MDPGRWSRVKEVAADAMEREGGAREAYLSNACAGDPALRAEVDRLLRAHEGADRLLDAAPATATTLPGSWAPTVAGDRVVEIAAGRRSRGGARPTGTAPAPTELVERGARRLATLAWLYAAGFLLAYLVRELSLHAVGGAAYRQAVHTPGQWMVGAFVAMALAVGILASRRSLPPDRLVAIGLAFEVAGSLGIALVTTSVAWTPGSGAWGVSWVCVWIMLFPFVVPARPRPAALAAFAAAAMGPVAMTAWAATRDFTWPPAGVVTAITVPNFVCAALAWFGARHLHRLGSELHAARRLGRYRLVEPLARGGMGEVWTARHDMLARPAALKLVRPELLSAGGSGAAALERFEREAQSTAALTSPHTVKLYDFGLTDDDVFYYVMERLEGLDLETMVRRHGPLPPARAIHLLRQACASLAEAHACGLVHRDIKPSNLFVCRQGLEQDFVKVLDFGIVRPRTDTTGATPAARAGGFEGTPGFVAPEGERGIAEPATDLYALGCVGWWLVTGRQVFEAAGAAEVLRRHRDEAPEPPSRHSGHPVPAGYDEAILACLEKDPSRRPRSAEALAARLAEIALPAWTGEDARAWWEAREGPDRGAPPRAE